MLKFNIDGQTLRRIDIFNPATDSVAYLKAKFNVLSSDWAGVAKRAFFRLGEDSYDAVINNDGICEIPHEVLKRTDTGKLQGNVNKIFVSVVGERGSIRITTNEIRVDLNVSGYTDAKNSEEPTPSAYSQFVAQVMDDNDATEAEIRALAERAEAADARVTEAETRIKSDYSNALKGRASGEVVRVDDVSPVEHNVKVNAHGKNLAARTNLKLSVVADGITYTVNGNGTITATGTATGTAYFLMQGNTNYEAQIPIKRGRYTLGLAPAVGCRISIGLRLFESSERILYYSTNQNAVTFDVTTDTARFDIILCVDTGHTVTGAVFKPQLEEGNTATEYEPYIDASTVTVTRCGKNLLQPRSNTGAGYTATLNNDGSVTVTGAANTTNGIYLTLATPSATNPLVLKAGRKYRIQSWSNNDKAILIKCVKLDGGDAWTSPTQFSATGGAEYKSIVQIYVESTNQEIGDTSLVGTYRFQLEEGEATTEFEKYIEPVTYTPEADGTVNGVTSLSPTMTLLTDTEGVTLDVEYNVDINIAFAKILETLSKGAE